MYYSEKVLGSNVVKHLRERGTAPLLVVGTDVLDRSDLASIQCFNFTAASNLSNILNQALKVKSLRDLFENVPPEALALPRLGSISLAVLGAAFEARNIGGSTPLESWVRKHQTNGHTGAPMVTFHTLKARDAAEHSQERKSRKERKHARRNQAHALRKARFGVKG